MTEIRVEDLASAADLLRAAQSLNTLAEQVGTLVEHTEQPARHVKGIQERLAAPEERFREHGHIGETATVGLGSCWDGS